MKKYFVALASIFSLIFLPVVAFAHEVYVLSPEQFQQGMQSTEVNAFTALNEKGNIETFLLIALGIIAVLALNFYFRRTKVGQFLHNQIERLSVFGPIVVRIAISASIFFSAWYSSFLGPEIPLSALPYGEVIRVVLFIVSGLFLLGLFVEVAAFATLLVYIVAFLKFGPHLFSYLNYLGGLLTLMFLGSRFLSFDRLFFGARQRFPKLKQYETAIVRVCYGLGIIYAAVVVKLLHPAVPLMVVTQYHMTDFHMLFPSDPLLVVLGATLSEIAIGIFIIFGFELRLTVLVSLFYITLSLFFFKEQVWPHFLLYGISLNLLFNRETFTLDNFFDKRLPKRRE